MDKTTWQEVETLFHRALEVPSENRSQFVSNATSDSQIKLEVLTLLESHQSDSRYLEEDSQNNGWSDAIDKLASSIQNEEFAPIENTISEMDDDKLIAMLEASQPDFVVKKVINRGGMGIVFHVYQRKLNRDVAVKVLSSPQIDGRMRRRFVRESKAIGQVNNDNVIRIYDVGQQQSIPFLVMELIDGPSLERLIKFKKQIRPKFAARITQSIALGLDAAHQCNLIHRDVKPGNILLEPVQSGKDSTNQMASEDYRAKLIDFGLAREVNRPTGETRDQLFAGTLAYMSPEQIAKPKSVDHRSDIYSLGMTLYEMLTGDQPFRGAPHMILQKIELAEPTSPRRLDDRIPRDLESICLKSMSKDPSRRYQTAKEMADDLSRFLNGHPTVARPVSTIEKTSRWVRRNPKLTWILGLVASMLMMITLGSLIFAWTISNKDREISRHREQAVNQRAQRIVDAHPGALLFAIEQAEDSKDGIISRLRENLDSSSNDLNRKLNAAVALSLLDKPRTDFILSQFDNLFVSPSTCRNLVAAIKDDSTSIQKLIDSVEEATNTKSKAKRIIVLAQLGEFRPWIHAAADRDQTLCTELIHTFESWHGDIDSLVQQIAARKSVELNWTFAHIMTLLDQRGINQSTRESVIEFFQDLQANSPEYVVSVGAEKVLKRWNIETPPLSPMKGSNWEELENGIRMVRVESMTSTMGRIYALHKHIGYPPHEVSMTRAFDISDAEITVKQFMAFINDPDCPSENKPAGLDEWTYEKRISPTEHHPIQNVSWYDAVKFCNWLSLQNELTPVYKFTGKIKEVKLRNDEIANYADVEIDHAANGFRLPNEHEFELACRLGSTTPYHFGVQREYAQHYLLASNHTAIPSQPVRNLLPNRLGIHDTIGNLWEWTNDWYCHIDDSPLTDLVGPRGPDPDRFGRTYRGGGVGSSSGENDAESRGHGNPITRDEVLGFRIARYAE